MGHTGMRAHLVFHLDSELLHGDTQSSGYRQWPPGPPRERLQTHGWGQHPFPCNLPEFCTLIFLSGGAAWQICGGP
jgi:hypothetical protein